MARDPKSRAELHRRLTELLGADNADTLMEALPPHSWDELVTKADLAARFDHSDELWMTRLDAMEHKLTASFRGELNAALTAQTRAILVSNVTLFVAGGSFVLAAARLL